MTKQNEFKELVIYRLCRDDEVKALLREEEKLYKLPTTEYITGIDYYRFINKVISECPTKYALLCHDDVVVPSDIDNHVIAAVRKVTEIYGDENWGVMGNAGIEMYTDKIVRFIRDPHTLVIPNRSVIPHLATHIDGNTMLLNVEQLRKKGVMMPESLKGFHLYDLVLVIESYKSGLLSLVDSELYVTHNSRGNQEDFDKSKVKEDFQRYWTGSFINHTIKTINGDVSFDQDYSYLYRQNNDKREDYYGLIHDVNIKSIKKKKKNLYIGIRTLLNRVPKLLRLLDTVEILQNSSENLNLHVLINVNNTEYEKHKDTIKNIKDKYTSLKIDFLYSEKSDKQYPRVLAIKDILGKIPAGSNNYVWFIDDDDFLIPANFEKVFSNLNKDIIFVGNSEVFEELWDEKSDNNFPLSSVLGKRINGEQYFKILTGENYIPLCSVIYPIDSVKNIFNDYKMLGDYYEDFAIFLLAQKNYEIRAYPFSIAGISYHGGNVSTAIERGHWNNSHVTFMSELINSGLVPEIYTKFIENHRFSEHDEGYIEFVGFTNGLIWKYLQVYRLWKKRIKKVTKRKSTNE